MGMRCEDLHLFLAFTWILPLVWCDVFHVYGILIISIF